MNSSETNTGLLVSVYTSSFKHLNGLLHNKLSPLGFNCLLGFIVVSSAYAYVTSRKTVSKAARSKISGNGAKSRQLGHWPPSEFKTPTPAPYPDWDVDTTPPLPYRAFKHDYKVNMGIRNMNWDSWIELDSEWREYHNTKLDRVSTKGSELYESSDDAIDAAYELCEEFREWLPCRYPQMFRKTELGVDNLVTGEQHVFMKNAAAASDKFARSDGKDPILIAALMVQDDLAIMIEDEKGQYYLKSGAIMLAGFWRFRDKFGMPLSEIHTSGDVPKYQTNLRPGMEKFFVRLMPDKPVVRNNYFIQTDDQLAWSSSIGHESEQKVGWYTADKARTINQIYFRSERQSLRRLPRSGGVVFTIRTYFTPLAKICEEPHVPRRLYNGIMSWSDDVAEYKGLETYKDVILPYLEWKAQQQEQSGISVEQDKSAYPF